MRSAVVLSRPEVGSSRSMRLGLISSSCPMLTRFRSPPEMPRMNGPPMIVSLHLQGRADDGLEIDVVQETNPCNMLLDQSGEVGKTASPSQIMYGGNPPVPRNNSQAVIERINKHPRLL
jgi:hypothetical protein